MLIKKIRKVLIRIRYFVLFLLLSLAGIFIMSGIHEQNSFFIKIGILIFFLFIPLFRFYTQNKRKRDLETTILYFDAFLAILVFCCYGLRACVFIYEKILLINMGSIYLLGIMIAFLISLFIKTSDIKK